MSGRGGRDRFRREHPLRSEEKSHHGRSNPPSRHLWVGNLSHNLDESSLTHHFLQFGELESVAFQPGRSYAFINFKNEEDAFAAMRELQGFSVAGNPLRIEFTKAEKSTPQRDDNYSQRRDEQRTAVRGSPFSQRDSRVRHSSPDFPYPDKSKVHDKNVEPSEVLWIGFPAQLKVDEFILRKAFAPFGEIEKITAFPGRTYAFVRFRSVKAACRAKDTLHGKLFGNPRVHLCFAKSESGTSNRERNSINAPQSPQFRSHGHASDSSRKDRDFGGLTGDLNVRSPRFMSNFEPGDPDIMSFGSKNDAWAGGNGAFEQRFYDLSSEQGIPGNAYEHRSSPPGSRGPHFREFSPLEFPRQGPYDDDPFDLPEDSLLFPGAKKLKTSSFAPENELPEYPFSDSAKAKRVPSGVYMDFQPDAYEKSSDSEPFGYKQIQDHPVKSTQNYDVRNDHWSAPYDGFQMVSAPLPSYPERTRLAPESQQLYVNKEWKWEGTIAKGGTPVCRARCFPVGKLMDMVLPEILDCTARTSLDMLAKHYYQAAGAWVVFFVPASDPDIALYNEFMNYLGEKQRAAVAKLDDKNTLFLVPPSDFSEKVLKVPGKLSISGVVLRLEHPGPSYGSIHQQEKKEANFTSLHGSTSVVKPISPSGLYPSMPTLPDIDRPPVRNTSFTENFSSGPLPASFSRSDVRNTSGNLSDSIGDTRHVNAFPQHKTMVGPKWSPHDMQNLSSNIRNIRSQTNSMVNSITEGYNPQPVSRIGNQALQENFPALSSMPPTALQPEQLVQLATTILGQQRHSGAVSTGSDWAQQNNALPNYQVGPETSLSQYGQIQQLQQQIPNLPAMPQRELQPGSLVNQQQQNAGQGEGDTEKRLQATLQLAAALLQQIQQGKGT
ncbi:flowering time control protein FPA [Coffea eugenioides]|uniref:flowering time control protein FPA n=1 Tax=Coffea eugenioides TaxID=49369 RepID=UPI000F60B568|nr:flowering time control protein FPA [Coffea eugenioides]